MDINFTLTEAEHQDVNFLVNAFIEIAVDWIYDTSGIEISRDLIRFDVYKNPRGEISVQGRIAYRGPYGDS